MVTTQEDPEECNAHPYWFLDPSQVIRGVHLIPSFAYGMTSEHLGPSIVRPASDNDKDWLLYYVNIFADCDMFMRYLGGGVGHRVTQFLTDFLTAPAVDEDEPIEEPDEICSSGVPQETGAISEPDVNNDDEEDGEDAGQQDDEDGEDDYGYNGMPSHEDDDGSDIDDDDGYADEDDLGPEDGEDEVAEGDKLEEAEGFAPL
ncbi:hypothetical protein EW026_g7735 [Hermanssonia centrifuga]|uniref:Uncharacterized protein n=1 Tax=Hermanssonia centrifuga TaxID=98765 RepID=A0A4V3X9B1_9APHY|nr:hypothetical protein EW026_g7735 [Hermanssonia centrifuga]